MSEENLPEPGDSEEETSGRGEGTAGLDELLSEAREQMERAAHDAGEVTVTGSAGGGAVTIELSGNLEVIAVHIEPGVIDPEDPPMLEDLVTAALRDALSAAVAVREEAAASLLPPGLDLGAMVGGLFGSGGGELPDLSQLDFGGLDFGELMGGLFGGPEGTEEDGPSGKDEGGAPS